MIREIILMLETDPEPFYLLFEKIIENSLQFFFKNTWEFMLKYSSVKTQALHRVLYVNLPLG